MTRFHSTALYTLLAILAWPFRMALRGMLHPWQRVLSPLAGLQGCGLRRCVMWDAMGAVLRGCWRHIEKGDVHVFRSETGERPQWAMRDSNPRPHGCDPCALAN